MKRRRKDRPVILKLRVWKFLARASTCWHNLGVVFEQRCLLAINHAPAQCQCGGRIDTGAEGMPPCPSRCSMDACSCAEPVWS